MAEQRTTDDQFISLEDIVRIFLRRKKLFIFLFIIFAALSVLRVATRKPLYQYAAVLKPGGYSADAAFYPLQSRAEMLALPGQFLIARDVNSQGLTSEVLPLSLTQAAGSGLSVQFVAPFSNAEQVRFEKQAQQVLSNVVHFQSGLFSSQQQRFSKQIALSKSKLDIARERLKEIDSSLSELSTLSGEYYDKTQALGDVVHKINLEDQLTQEKGAAVLAVQAAESMLLENASKLRSLTPASLGEISVTQASQTSSVRALLMLMFFSLVAAMAIVLVVEFLVNVAGGSAAKK
jgi:hypothetical protein